MYPIAALYLPKIGVSTSKSSVPLVRHCSLLPAFLKRHGACAEPRYEYILKLLTVHASGLLHWLDPWIDIARLLRVLVEVIPLTTIVRLLKEIESKVPSH